NEQTLKESSQKIGCQYVVLDVSDVTSHVQFLYKAEELLGGLDCLVNNAGISLHEMDFSAVTQESFDTQINTNLKGPFFLTQQFVRRIKELQKPASVLFISSETGETADERPYGWTKAATNSMVKGLAYRLASDGIRVNAVAPGVTASDMTGLKEDGNLYAANSPSGRIYLPEEVAEVASFLLSDVSGCISGQVITCNNGKTINARWK
ncbi:MAG: SDR family oxidoreductase, partial [Bacteroidaceae bacterium]|nr:SDR family oxidoreductase [Bacteroidaceae bacterium]